MMKSSANSTTERGFTLLELLVVVFIIGLMSGVVVLAIGDGGRGESLKQEAHRLVAVLELAGQEAVMRGDLVGAGFSEDGYHFLVLDNDKWAPFEPDAAFRAHRLPEGARFSLSLSDQGVPLQASGEADEPQLLFLPSGETEPFQLTLHLPESDHAFLIIGDQDANVTTDSVKDDW